MLQTIDLIIIIIMRIDYRSIHSPQPTCKSAWRKTQLQVVNKSFRVAYANDHMGARGTDIPTSFKINEMWAHSTTISDRLQSEGKCSRPSRTSMQCRQRMGKVVY